MLKTNSKKAKENIQKYIIANTDIDSENFEEIANYIIDNFNNYNCYYEVKRFNYNYKAIFFDWLHGLPSCLYLRFIYVYNRFAKNDLMQILEETQEEAEKYTEEQAEKLLICLIYRELTKIAPVKLFL